MGLKEVNYDAGRSMASFVSFLDKHPGPNIGHVPHFSSISGLINGHLIALLAMTYVFRAERHHHLARNYHALAFGDTAPIGAVESLHEELELMIYSMRKALDHFVQGMCLTLETDDVVRLGRIRIDSLGRALSARDARSGDHDRLIECLFGSDGAADTSGFLDTLNVISNSYKHGFLLPESQGYISPDTPNILLFDKKANNLRVPATVHNHHAGHLMMGFQDTINRLLMSLGSKPLS